MKNKYRPDEVLSVLASIRDVRIKNGKVEVLWAHSCKTKIVDGIKVFDWEDNSCIIPDSFPGQLLTLIEKALTGNLAC